MTKQKQATLALELEELLKTSVIEEEIDTLEYVLPELKYTRDVDARRDLPELLDDRQEKEEILVKFELLALLLDSAATVEEISVKIDETYLAEKERYEENMQAVFAQTKPFEKTARALHLLYRNATIDSNVYIMPVNKARFADSANPGHFTKFRHYLRQKFYAWRDPECQSPFYISYIGNIGSKSAMDEIAMIAHETRALAVVDMKEMSKAQDVIDYANRLKIKGIPPHLGHLVVMGTWIYAHNAFDIEFERDENGRLRRKEKLMSVPAAGAFIGKMMSVPVGEYITGLEKPAIIGIKGVRVEYDLERVDAERFSECGVIQIEPEGNIQGTATANNSNNYDLRKFPKVDVANFLLKDLVVFSNKKAYSKWGERQKRELKKEIEIFLNRSIKRELIEEYEINHIAYDEHEEKVDIEISVRFYEVADRFDINLHGKRENLQLTKHEFRKKH
ncbi:MAG: hypothetical protein JNK77_17130 [Saprospiraceae bacterium]|nr:hypothetical protein [Saprospiraceae bacterium]